MALFPMSGVLRRFAPAACEEAVLRSTICTPRRKPLPAIAKAQARRAGLCGLAHQARSVALQHNSSFMNWKLAWRPTLVTLFMDRH